MMMMYGNGNRAETLAKFVLNVADTTSFPIHKIKTIRTKPIQQRTSDAVSSTQSMCCLVDDDGHNHDDTI
jgi:hypothetical protein